MPQTKRMGLDAALHNAQQDVAFNSLMQIGGQQASERHTPIHKQLVGLPRSSAQLVWFPRTRHMR